MSPRALITIAARRLWARVGGTLTALPRSVMMARSNLSR
jgi:hypothetical protein